MYGTNPSPSGDENCHLIDSNREAFGEPTHPHSGTKIKSSRINYVKISVNQPIPRRGRKSLLFAPLKIIFWNQPIPKRGRKFRFCGDWIFTLHEPTHPQAGTKIQKFLRLFRQNQEPTHPHSGTKIECRHRNRLSYRPNQPIPKRGRK